MFFLEGLYRIGLFCHRRLSKPKKVPAFVISIGNITTGGCGKTQMVLKIAQILKERKVCILSRGYKARLENKGGIVTPNSRVEDVGDEPLMLSKMTNIPVMVGKNRYKSAMFAISNLGIDTIILDDGFQHWGLFRNLDILLINGGNPFGNYRLLPCGILREPLAGIERADIIVITKRKDLNIIEIIRRFNKTSPIFEAEYKPSALLDNNGKMYPLSLISNKNVLAISGIQDSSSFEKTLGDLGCYVEGIRFPDHHFYSSSEIEKIKHKAKEFDLVVSTLKDKEKLKGEGYLFLNVSFSISDEPSFIKLLTPKEQ
ncbi:MAG: tetraacyldisaccharide 4'-kinase [bacterium]